MASNRPTRAVPADLPEAGATDLPLDHALSLLLADETENALRWGAAVLESGPWTPSALVVTARLLESDGPTARCDRRSEARRAAGDRRGRPAARDGGDRGSALVRGRGRRTPRPDRRSVLRGLGSAARRADGASACLSSASSDRSALSSRGRLWRRRLRKIVEIGAAHRARRARRKLRRGSPRCRSSARSAKRPSTTCSPRSIPLRCPQGTR